VRVPISGLNVNKECLRTWLCQLDLVHPAGLIWPHRAVTRRGPSALRVATQNATCAGAERPGCAGLDQGGGARQRATLAREDLEIAVQVQNLRCFARSPLVPGHYRVPIVDGDR
jgi:hypothetical protein